METFGSGTNYGPALPAGITSYTFISGTPNDGQYTLFFRTNMYDSWHNAPDHTPDNQPDGFNGKSLLVNASFSTGEFYKRVVSGLCVNTTFEFSAWVMNVFNSGSGACDNSSIPIDVTFEIWNASETVLLKSGSTNPIQATNSVNWKQFGLVFTTAPGQTAVVLKMKNNGAGGCGNDLAIDDISFRSCGDYTSIVSPTVAGNIYSVCEDDVPVNLALNVVIPNPAAHVFQWQQSNDTMVWTDIPGQNTTNYNVSNLTTTKSFRVKVAQDAANLANPFCLTVSEIFSIAIIPKPNIPSGNGDFTICSDESIPAFTVTTDPGTAIDWYDAPTGGNLLLTNSVTFTPTAAGIYYAEAIIPNKDCKSISRTALRLTINQQPLVTDETFTICENQLITLDAGVNNVDYDWSTGAITKTIETRVGGIYTVTVTSPDGCDNIKTITVIENSIPVISHIDTNDGNVTIITTIAGNDEFSIDGIHFQDSNFFANVIGGINTAYVRDKLGCGSNSEEFLNLVFPRFFTPNGDGYSDKLIIRGLSSIPNATFTIFDRFGKLITQLNKNNPEWNGTFNGQPLPASDYWYRMTLENGKEYKGHFSIKR